MAYRMHSSVKEKNCEQYEKDVSFFMWTIWKKWPHKKSIHKSHT